LKHISGIISYVYITYGKPIYDGNQLTSTACVLIYHSNDYFVSISMSPLNYSGVYKIEHSGSDMRRITSCAGKEEIHNWPLGRDMYEYRVNVECHGPCKYISYFFIWECTLPPICPF